MNNTTQATWICSESDFSIQETLRKISEQAQKQIGRSDLFDVIVMKDDLCRSLFEILQGKFRVQHSLESENLLASIYGIPVVTGKTNEEVSGLCVSLSVAGNRVLFCYKDGEKIVFQQVPTNVQIAFVP